MNQPSSKSGFTLIELMLAMAFVSVLLVVVAMTTVQISNIYDRGLTLKTVNQAGRDLSDSLRRDITTARQADVEFVSFDEPQAQNLNRLCLGNYSYLWNYGKQISDDDAVMYRDSDGGVSDQPIGLARISDPGASYCQAGDDGQLPTVVDQTVATEMLATDSQELALHGFEFMELATDESVSQAVYSLSFTLGTNDQAVLETSNQQCKPPTEESNIEFCAVNKFEMAVRANGV